MSMQAEQKYHPELISRRGEMIAWLTFSLAGATWAVLLLMGASIHPALRFLTFFLLGSGLVISFGNWMDRKTLLCLDADGIQYQNGLRKISLQWDDILRVEVYPSNWGDKVNVRSAQQQFNFRTLGEVEVKGDVKGRMGFANGEEILQQIITNAGLEGEQQPSGGYSYRRG